MRLLAIVIHLIGCIGAIRVVKQRIVSGEPAFEILFLIIAAFSAESFHRGHGSGSHNGHLQVMPRALCRIVFFKGQIHGAMVHAFVTFTHHTFKAHHSLVAIVNAGGDHVGSVGVTNAKHAQLGNFAVFA